jgi:ring-1,2-phenylacetyl-CoA epoxidase subunit PaaE
MTENLTQIFQPIINFIISLGQQFATGFIFQYAFILVFYIVVWILFAKQFSRYRIQTQKRAGKVQIFDEFKNGLIVLLINTVTTPFLLWLNDLGYINIYQDINAYGGIWYVLFTSLVLIVVSDGWFYWTHRWFHTPKVYKYIHAVHHKSLDTTPFTSLSFHVVEGFLQSAFIYILVFVMPLNTLAIGITQVVGLLNNIKSHLGYDFYPAWFAKTPLKYLANSTHHNLHHTRYNGNYGLFFTYWDILCGTEFDNQNQMTDVITHRKAAPVIKDNSVYKTLVISKLERETADAMSVYFEPTDKGFYQYKPGQYINLRFKIGKKNYDRVFSLSSSPIDKFLRITVKKHAIVTEYLNSSAKIGDTVKALYPTGDFYVDPQKENKDQYLLVAGGSGITPIYSILRSVLANEPKSKITLLYANQSQDSIIFLSELKSLVKNNPQLNVKHFISGKNRLSKQDIANVLDLYPSSQTFVCGLETLKKSVKKYLKELENENKIFEEDFADGALPFWWKSI